MSKNLLSILAIMMISAIGHPYVGLAQSSAHQPLTELKDAEKAIPRAEIEIINKCQKWVVFRVSPFENPESNKAHFKIRVPIGTQIVTGNKKGKEFDNIFTIKTLQPGQTYDVCG